MLVLTRKPQEKIQIGDNIVITVLQFRGNAIRIGIEAPQNVRVMRGEISKRDAEQADAPVKSNQANEDEQIQIEVVEITRTAKPKHSVETRKNEKGTGERLRGSRFQQSPLSGKVDAQRKQNVLRQFINDRSRKHANPHTKVESDSDFPEVDHRPNVSVEQFANREMAVSLR